MVKIILKNKISVIRLILLLSLISVSGLILLRCNLIIPRTPEQYYDEKNSVKLSDNEISIITPENITYEKPMRGYYPGTYGFENDEIGSVPQGWIDSSLGSGLIEVIQEEDQHKNVLHIQSSSTIDNQGVALLELENLISGTVEYWIKFDNANPPAHYIYAFDLREDLNIKVAVRIKANEWTYYDGGVYQSICPAEANKWYRLRVTWDMVSDTSDIYVYHADNTLAGSVIDATNSATGTIVNRLYIAMNNAVINTNIWVDAVGVSWDLNYNPGDNLNEGLLLSFENSTSLDWRGYSLDGLANKTILGNTAIPLPANGTHNIQVFGNNSLGAMYASNLRYFTINITNYIEILTPENKTYSAPMSGYYPATYGFENDDDGSDPEGWILSENPPNFEIEVVSEKQGHKKVVHIYDNENAWRSMNHYPDGNPTIGTIELWVFGVDVTDYRFDIGLWDTTMRRGFVVIIADDKWQYWDAGYHDVSNVGIPQDNTWHHLRIDFRCAGAPAYEGLSMASYKIIVDGIESGEIPFWEAANHLERLSIGTDAAPNSEWWVDAIGMSWDPNYNIGDNFNEGLLLSFDNNPRLDWMSYSLDGLANKTILGNTTLPLPANGAHNIQVFGNDSLGAMYASNLRHFTLDLPMINIITPENKTYTEPMSGYYPATYGFENDINGVEPNEWLRWDPGIGTVRVISEKVGHKKVLEVDDNAGSTGDDPGIYQLFSEDHNSGIIELWVYKESGNCPIWISLLDTSLTRYITVLGIDSYVSQYNNNRFNINSDPGGWQTFGPTFYDDQWYHISICWNGTTKTVDVYINGILEADDYSYTHTDALDVDRLEIRSAWGTTGLFYIDAIGFSWDPKYNIRDNFIEGLLLNFMNRTTLDWMGYSLNGLTNKTILGDVTIPFLSDGSHSIQVFGNDTLGTMYESEIRYFSINVPPPSISIITPSNDEFYSNIAPSFSLLITTFYQITTWYTLDGGGTNITFTGSSGTINQTEWDGQGEGPVTIRFYVNDSYGGFNYAEININKDITDPVITINSPSFGAQFTTIPPDFDISVNELNIDAIWYTLDGGLNNYDISQYTGYIDSGAWNAAPEGAITIRFYVRDRAGNTDYEDVIIQKSTPPYIPPDNSLIIIISVAIGVFIAATCIILVVTLIRKRRARPPKPPKPPKPARPPKPEMKIPLKQERRIVPPSRVIVQREVMVIEKKPSEREKLDTEAEKRTRFEEEKETKQVKCLYCGTYIDYYARICPKCGNEQR